MIKGIIEGTHNFTKVSVVIQIIFWIIFFIVFITELFHASLGQYPIIIDITNILALIILPSPFIGLLLNSISLLLDKRKAFAIVLFSGNVVLIGIIIYLFISIASQVGVD